MSEIGLRDQMWGDRDAVHAAYRRIEAGMQYALRGRGYLHPRYASGEAIDLAVVVASAKTAPGVLDPRDPYAVHQLDFMDYNRLDHGRSEMWDTRPGDVARFSGQIPTNLGRFNAFAMAKINRLAHYNNPEYKALNTSHSLYRTATGFGTAGFAGGIREDDAFIGVSGAFHVHDHAIARAFRREFAAPATRTAETTGQTLSGIFETIHAVQVDLFETSADQLSGAQVRAMLNVADRAINAAYGIAH